ncbi:Uncharacterised protein [Mycobacteroides abscessus subsp. abscessus]|nr:Uncharacterised protein [Mycobacteroides abscessus subsp. abscessus]
MSDFFCTYIQKQVPVLFVAACSPSLKHILHGNGHFSILPADQLLQLLGKQGIRTFRPCFELQFFYMIKHKIPPRQVYFSLAG